MDIQGIIDIRHAKSVSAEQIEAYGVLLNVVSAHHPEFSFHDIHIPCESIDHYFCLSERVRDDPLPLLSPKRSSYQSYSFQLRGLPMIWTQSHLSDIQGDNRRFFDVFFDIIVDGSRFVAGAYSCPEQTENIARERRYDQLVNSTLPLPTERIQVDLENGIWPYTLRLR